MSGRLQARDGTRTGCGGGRVVVLRGIGTTTEGAGWVLAVGFTGFR